jgi:hypothetical protein
MDNLGEIIPSLVFEAVNYLLKEKYRGSCKCRQDGK